MLRKLFDKKGDGSPSGEGQFLSADKYPRYSGAWSTMRKRLKAEQGLRIIDSGTTSPTNINYLTNLGHSIFLADPVQEACGGAWERGKDADDNIVWDVQGFMDQTLEFSGRMFDVVLLWTTLDYLPEPFVVPLVNHLHAWMNPGGQVLAFFHTGQRNEDTQYCRFSVTDTDEVEMQAARAYPIRRAFTNRSIQSLFSRFSGFKQFLAKDALSECIITR